MTPTLAISGHIATFCFRPAQIRQRLALLVGGFAISRKPAMLARYKYV